MSPLLQEEIGREMKVSELQPEAVVWVAKEGRDQMAMVWVVDIRDVYVHFRTGNGRVNFFAERCGPDLEEITDNDHLRMKMYECLVEP